MNDKMLAIEDKRKMLHGTYKKELISGVFFLVGGILVLLAYLSTEFNWVLVIAIVLGVIALIMFGRSQVHVKSFKQLIKGEFIHLVLGDIFDNMVYAHNGSIPMHHIVQTGMIKRPDRYRGEDYISGRYKDVNFEVADVEMKERVERRDSKGNRTVTYQTYFKGRWYIYKFERLFEGTLKLSQGRGFNMQTRGLEKIDTESIVFNKTFAIFASSKEYAFYHLTPRIIEKFSELENMHRGQIMFYFHNNELHIGVNDRKDYLELPLSKAINEQSLKDFQADIDLIPAIINEMRLDSRKFKKEERI